MSAVLTEQYDHATERRDRRGRALRISTVLAGVVHLVLAGILIGIPGSSPTLDPLPVPEQQKQADPRPGSALSRRAAATPAHGHPTAPPAPVTAPEGSASAATPRPTPTRVRERGAVPPSGARTSPPRELSKAIPGNVPQLGRVIVPVRPTVTRTPGSGSTPGQVAPGRARKKSATGGQSTTPRSGGATTGALPGLATP
ncbi:hypothetical protein GCM10022224_069980 [Nonomuraea antimicrobica]|uniref:Uncharacterized protein n=1 Tax=Nonomuraea antimicrobica TaxID=561173 RepID=A0ABP7CTM0_9ACTN